MTGALEVSVVIPTRNRWELLSRSALRAALGQEDVRLEVIVVDDGSTDGTAAGLASVDDVRLRVLRNEAAGGVSAARNRGLEAARGEWVAFLDDDDVWAPRKLRTQLDLAEESGAAFVFSSAVTMDSERRPIAYRDVPAPEALGRPFEAATVPGGCSNVVVRTSVARQVGGFDGNLSLLADWDLWLRLALAGTPALCPEVHVGYLSHGGNMALSSPARVFSETRYIAEKYRALSPTGATVDVMAPMRWVAWENFWAGRKVRGARVFVEAGLRGGGWRDFSRALRFLVWAVAPERLSRRLSRLVHGRSAAVAPSPPPDPPAWLTAYPTLPL
jgi:GT2 family glycosyltransferase